MKTLDQGAFHTTRRTDTIPNRRPTTPQGKLELIAVLRQSDHTAFFHADGRGNIWMTPETAMMSRAHIFYCANTSTLWVTAYNAQWRERFRPALRHRLAFASYCAMRQREAVRFT